MAPIRASYHAQEYSDHYGIESLTMPVRSLSLEREAEAGERLGTGIVRRSLVVHPVSSAEFPGGSVSAWTRPLGMSSPTYLRLAKITELTGCTI